MIFHEFQTLIHEKFWIGSYLTLKNPVDRNFYDLRQDSEWNLLESLRFRILKDLSRLSQGMTRIETRFIFITTLFLREVIRKQFLLFSHFGSLLIALNSHFGSIVLKLNFCFSFAVVSLNSRFGSPVLSSNLRVGSRLVSPFSYSSSPLILRISRREVTSRRRSKIYYLIRDHYLLSDVCYWNYHHLKTIRLLM